MTFEEALAKLIQDKEELSFLPIITTVEFDQGGDVQIGDMTWDHDNASFTIHYKDPEGTPGRNYKYYIDMESYNVSFPVEERQGRTGFAGFMDDLLRVS